MQLTWRMEALQVESAASYLEGIDIEGYSCIISLNDDGSNKLHGIGKACTARKIEEGNLPYAFFGGLSLSTKLF